VRPPPRSRGRRFARSTPPPSRTPSVSRGPAIAGTEDRRRTPGYFFRLEESDPELRDLPELFDLLELFDFPELLERLELALWGTFAPFLRASERPIAIACFRLVTFFPLLPLLRVPFLRLRMALSTVLWAFLPYFLATEASFLPPEGGPTAGILREPHSIRGMAMPRLR
jgi:hypothetical protein